jgi:hypothetical protein
MKSMKSFSRDSKYTVRIGDSLRNTLVQELAHRSDPMPKSISIKLTDPSPRRI